MKVIVIVLLVNVLGLSLHRNKADEERRRQIHACRPYYEAGLQDSVPRVRLPVGCPEPGVLRATYPTPSAPAPSDTTRLDRVRPDSVR